MTRTLQHFIAFLQDNGITFAEHPLIEGDAFDSVLSLYEVHAREIEVSDHGHLKNMRQFDLCIVMGCGKDHYPYCELHNTP